MTVDRGLGDWGKVGLQLVSAQPHTTVSRTNLSLPLLCPLFSILAASALPDT